jgi:hypothetical protein
LDVCEVICYRGIVLVELNVGHHSTADDQRPQACRQRQEVLPTIVTRCSYGNVSLRLNIHQPGFSQQSR